MPIKAVAVGTLAASDGATFGDVVVTAEGHALVVTLDHFTTSVVGQIDVRLSPIPSDGRCPADTSNVVLGEADGSGGSWFLTTPNIPTNFRSVLLHLNADDRATAKECAVSVLAAASLIWNTEQ